MKFALSSLAVLGAALAQVTAQVPVGGQCGGKGWDGFRFVIADSLQKSKVSISFILTTLPTFTLKPASPLPTRITGIPTIYPPWTTIPTTTPCPTVTSTVSVKVPVTVTVVQPTTFTTTATVTSVSVVTRTTEIIYTQSCSSTSTTKTTPTTTPTQSPPTTTTTPTQSPPTTTTTTRTTPTTTTVPTTTKTPIDTTTTKTTTTITTDRPCETNYPPDWAGKNFTYKGVNIAGFEWGCLIDGSCTYPNSPPLTSTADGPGQMKWFVSNGMNTFRLPIGWQYATPSLGGAFDPSEWAQYDKLVQNCLAVNAYCIIDIHNYGKPIGRHLANESALTDQFGQWFTHKARWNGQVIGQSSGVPDAPFIKLWQMIASYYVQQPRVIFGVSIRVLLGENNIGVWAQTLQKVVAAIRAIAPRHVILLPGIEWAHADTFISSGSAAALDAISNPDGSKTNLIFDIHQWLDKANNGTDPDCVTDNIPVFEPLAQWLRCHNRTAFLSATGGGNEDGTNCNPLLCQQMQFLLANSDVFVGYTGWAAGSYD
ncbi:hypothetical protein FRC00_001438, partial [Tulasnella sp. 408]